MHAGPVAHTRMPCAMSSHSLPHATPTPAAAGYRHVDCASIYDNQDVVGQGLKKFIESVSVEGVC